MSAVTQPGSPDQIAVCLNTFESRTMMDMSSGHATSVERTRPRRGTDDSMSTFVGSEKGNEKIDVQTLELQLRASDSLTLHPSLASRDVEGRPTQDRAIFGRWQRIYIHWLTAYRALVVLIVLANLGAIIAELVTDPAVETALTATAANIVAAALLRQEELINLSFGLISKLPPGLPLPIRRTIGDFHHYGGLHVGCALSALLWYIMFTGLNTVRVLNLLSLDDMTTILYMDIVLSYTTLLTILVVCLTAVPRFRVRFHNTFETTHRFGGWAALLVLWLHAGITTLTPGSLVPLYAHPSLWSLALTTVLIIIPWLRIRRVPITAYHLSTRELHLTFPYTHMPFTSTIRLSTSPLREWHAFATIPSCGSSAHIVISAAGDWTSKLLAHPPTQLWIRNPPTQNFLALVPLFKHVLLVATGAGIAPVLSLLVSPRTSNMLAQKCRVRVLWCVAEPEVTHWGFVLDAIRGVDPEAVVLDSRIRRPDVAFEARWLCEKDGLEAVFVVSNPRVTGEVVRECKGRGLAAFGAVFDS